MGEYFKRKDPFGQVGNAEGVVSEKIYRGEGTKDKLQPARRIQEDVTYDANGHPKFDSPKVLKPVGDGERTVIGGIDISAYEDPSVELDTLKTQHDGLMAEGRIAEAGFFQAKMDRISATAPANPEGNLMGDLDFGEDGKKADNKLAA